MQLKSIYVSISDCARDCIAKALETLELPGESGAGSGGAVQPGEPGEFQLWVRTKLDEAPYPLIGHEIPLVIKLHWMRQTFNNKNQKTYDEYRAGCRCSFILRKAGQLASPFPGPDAGLQPGSQKKKLKKVKSSMKLSDVFRRVSQGSRGPDPPDSSPDPDKPPGPGLLFGRPLSELCGDPAAPRLPRPVAGMLSQLHTAGPATTGIFRRGPNVRAMRDIRDKLDLGEQVDWSEISVFVTAALLKDLLRSLPDCLLGCEEYTSWTGAVAEHSSDPAPLQSCLARLPQANTFLLHHLLYILHLTADNSEENMMTASNLSICVGPSLLWTSDPAYMLEQNYSKEVSALIQLLIEDFPRLFGSEPPALFCSPAQSSTEGSPEPGSSVASEPGQGAKQSTGETQLCRAPAPGGQ